MNLVEIDYRFGGKPIGETYDGLLILSFEAEKKYVDRAKALGWDGISFVTNTPINRNTGRVDTVNTSNPNTDPDRTYPDDLWKLVDYAKSIGLKVHIQLEIVDYLTDVLVSPQTLASSVLIPELFQSIQDYQVWIAKDAQAHSVDSINIASLFFLEEQYKNLWLNNVAALRKIYKGEISATTHFNGQPLSYFSAFDFINVFGFGDLLSKEWPNSVEEIIQLYTSPELLFPNGAPQPNHITKLLQFIEASPVPVALLKMIPAVSAGPGDMDPWQPWVSTDIPVHLQKYLNAEIDYTNQFMAIDAFFNLVNDQFAGKIRGTTMAGYGSWADSKYYFSMPNQEQIAFNLFLRMSATLNPSLNKVADSAIAKYLSPLFPHFIHYDGAQDGNYQGTNGQNNSFIWMGGKDQFKGADLLDKAFLSLKFNEVKVEHSAQAVVVSKNQEKLILSKVERIIFIDQGIAYDLTGNAGTTAKILSAVFGKESLSNKNYVGIGLHFLDSGWTYDNLAGLALDAAGAKTNDQIVSLLWTNVIGTKPTAADKAPFITLLENGMTAGALAHLAADTSFNATNINLVGLAQTGIEFIAVG
jgi:hypothetical protein